MPTTTPTGARTAIASLPGTSEGITSPTSAYDCAAASRSIPAASVTLNIPQPKVEPVSSVMMPASSRPRSDSSSAAPASSSRRRAGGVADHSGNAAAAAFTAARASSTLAATAEPTISPV
jgi:hypothetical protein